MLMAAVAVDFSGLVHVVAAVAVQIDRVVVVRIGLNAFGQLGQILVLTVALLALGAADGLFCALAVAIGAGQTFSLCTSAVNFFSPPAGVWAIAPSAQMPSRAAKANHRLVMKDSSITG